MAKEIERKFLVDKNLLPTLKNGVLIQQGYLLNTPEKVVRVRIADEKAFITVKTANENISRNEWEYEIPLKDALEMLKGVSVIKKTRYEYLYEGNVFEIDFFKGEFFGLILAEIELDSEDQKFAKPNFLKEDVSLNKKYYNSEIIKSL